MDGGASEDWEEEDVGVLEEDAFGEGDGDAVP